MLLTGQHNRHLPDAPSTYYEALQYYTNSFPVSSQPLLVLYTSSFCAFLVASHLDGLCSVWVWFLGVLHSCTLSLHWEMPNPLPLRNVHSRENIGFQRNTVLRSRPVHSLHFRSGPLLWSSRTNVRLSLCLCLIWQHFDLKKCPGGYLGLFLFLYIFFFSHNRN